MSVSQRIGTITNYYGGLWVKAEGTKYYWCIEDYKSKEPEHKIFNWQEIPSVLYHALTMYAKYVNTQGSSKRRMQKCNWCDSLILDECTSCPECGHDDCLMEIKDET
jgi:hypothetical protein